MTLAAPSRILIAIVAAVVAIAAMSLVLFQRSGGEPSGVAQDAPPAATSRAELVRYLERSPRDGRAWVLLARMDFDADRFADAATAYERALAAGDKVARDPAIWCEYADALGMAQGGSLAGKPRELVMRALAQNPAHPKALEMAGSAAFEAGDFAAAARYWRDLFAQLPEGSRERTELGAAIRRADESAMLPLSKAGR